MSDSSDTRAAGSDDDGHGMLATVLLTEADTEVLDPNDVIDAERYQLAASAMYAAQHDERLVGVLGGLAKPARFITETLASIAVAFGMLILINIVRVAAPILLASIGAIVTTLVLGRRP